MISLTLVDLSIGNGHMSNPSDPVQVKKPMVFFSNPFWNDKISSLILLLDSVALSNEKTEMLK